MARGARCFTEGRRQQFVGIGEAGLLTRQGAHANALFDVGAALLDDAILERPGLIARELKIQIRSINARAGGGGEGLHDRGFIETGGFKDQLLRQSERIGGKRRGINRHRSAVGHGLVHGDMVTGDSHRPQSRRCVSAGNSSRVLRCASGSSVAVTTPSPSGNRASTAPQ